MQVWQVPVPTYLGYMLDMALGPWLSNSLLGLAGSP